MRPLRALLPLVLAVALLAGCPGDDSDTGACTPESEKRAVAELVYAWYLYPETLPPTVDLTQYASAAELLDAMTANARAQDRDRGWSYLTTATASQTFFEEGTSVGFGIGFVERSPNKLLVKEVYPGSPAADAGFVRGDEILAIGESADALVAVAERVAADLASGTTTIGALFGPSTPGVVRAIEVRTAAGTTEVRTLAKRVFGLDPVPAVDGAQRWRIFPRTEAERPPAGYVALRTFIAPADALLREAFAAFDAAGVTDVAVDLRYNGGGLVSTGELLANLLGGGLAGSTMLRWTYNPARSAFDDVDLFAPPATAVPKTRIAFITTHGSASASELVPNVLEPYREVAIVGDRTYGKPVGQSGFRLGSCETLAYLVSFALANAEGDAGYYDGLPDAPATGLPAFSGDFCPAADDLANPIGDPAEASTAAALAWLETGTCPGTVAAKPGPSGALRAAAADAYPQVSDPTLAQRHVPGLF